MQKLEPESTNAKFKFQIWHLCFITAVIAMGVAIHTFSIFISIGWIALCWLAIKLSRYERIAAVLLLFGLWFLYVLLVPMKTSGQPATQQTVCLNTQRQLMIALLNYESANGQFPSADERGSVNSPPHSWRVKILPFLEMDNLYDRYDFAEPWDGPNNSKLVDEIPDVYQCPLNDHGNQPHYKLVVGPGSLFDRGVVPASKNIPDGAGNTVAIVEDAANPVNWMEPEGISIDDAVKLFPNGSRHHATHRQDGLLSTSYSSGGMILFDGSTHRAGSLKNEAELRKLFGINDGVADINRLEPFWATEPKPGKQAILISYISVMVASLAFLVFRKCR